MSAEEKLAEGVKNLKVDDSVFDADEGKGNEKFLTYDNDFCMANGGFQAPKLDTLDFDSISDKLKSKNFPKPEDGKPYIAFMWAQYHKPGYKFIALYSKLAEKFRKDIPVVGISFDPEGPEVINKFIDDPKGKYSTVFPLEFTVAHDKGNVFKKAFADSLRAALSPPHAFLINKEGKVVWHQDHSELGATVPTYMQLMEAQVTQFLKDGTIKKVGDKAEEESEEESDDGAVVGDDFDLF